MANTVARAFKITAEVACKDDEIISETFLVDSIPANVLFDTGSTRSIVSTMFSNHLAVPWSLLDHALETDVAVGKSVTVREKYDGCSIDIDDNVFPLTLIPMRLKGFDVVIGMSWMKANQVVIKCAKNMVRVPLPSGGHAVAYGERCPGSTMMISVLKARKCLAKGCFAFFAHVIDTTKRKVELADVDVVREYPDVFPDELPGLPPPREVEFQIDLVPGAAPVAKEPYRLAPSEMKEIMSQLQELSDKGFIRPSSSP